MSIVQIPVDSENSVFTETLNLEGVDYLLRIYWNSRDESWYLDIRLPDDTSIIDGIKMVVNYGLISYWEVENMPPGALILYDDSNSEIPCGRYDLGERCKLIYITSDDESLQS